MTHHRFQHPLFGIFVQNSNTMHEHCFGAIFDRADDGRITDYRPISYIGSETPPDTSHTQDAYRTDGGVLVPITPTAANRLVAQLDEVRADLTAEPKRQRYYYSQRTKLANALQAEKGRIPTNCVDFLMRAAQQAGIDVGIIAPTLADSDHVDDVTDVLDTALRERGGNRLQVAAALRGMTTLQHAIGTIGSGTKALYFSTEQNTTVLDAVNSLPVERLQDVLHSAPLGEPGQRISHFQPVKTLEPRATLASLA